MARASAAAPAISSNTGPEPETSQCSRAPGTLTVRVLVELMACLSCLGPDPGSDIMPDKHRLSAVRASDSYASAALTSKADRSVTILACWPRRTPGRGRPVPLERSGPGPLVQNSRWIRHGRRCSRGWWVERSLPVSGEPPLPEFTG
jgi:hypothetical protein